MLLLDLVFLSKLINGFIFYYPVLLERVRLHVFFPTTSLRSNLTFEKEWHCLSIRSINHETIESQVSNS